MEDISGGMYTLDFDDGTGDGNYPETRIRTEKAVKVDH
jgi:hypothetical protein